MKLPLKASTKDLISEIYTMPLLVNSGDIKDATSIFKDWGDVITELQSDACENFRNESRNRFSIFLADNHYDEFKRMHYVANTIISKYKKPIKRHSKLKLKQRHVPKQIIAYVATDLMLAIIEYEFSHVYRDGIYLKMLDIYKSGYLPIRLPNSSEGKDGDFIIF